MSARGDESGKPDASHRQKTVGRYALYGPISAGGMASVHFGRLLGPIGFRRTVAIKRLHAAFAMDPEFVAMFLDEARLAARIRHPNVVGTLDVVEADNELFLVMDYVGGLSLSALLREAVLADIPLPPEHAAAILIGALHGLHAAHETRNADGESLGIVHRDISPQNILVGEDGVARVIDFGIAKAAERAYLTRDNELRGKVLYMAPEQLARQPVDHRADLYAASVVLWEMLTSRRFIEPTGNNPVEMIMAVREHRPEPPSRYAPDLPRALDQVVLRGLARNRSDRFATALEMAAALEDALTPSSQREVSEWVARTAPDTLQERAEVLRKVESDVDAAVETSVPGLAPADEARAPNVLPLLPHQGAIPLPPGPHTSQVWADGQEPSPRRRVDLRPLAFVAVVGAILAAWYIGAQGRGSPPPAVSNSDPTSIADPAPSFPPPTPIEPPASAAGSGTSSAVVSSVTVATTRPSVHRPAAQPAPRPPRGKCNPPFTMDHGIRVPKPECL